ncbi:hypothetical protein [Petrocella sp. FN5]|uniref:hypothetical protein n=1 Tax=Petrocella sp. FN5 TaxID=3032002 RepID=UPI0023DA564A|nr:hypothetical protein [Petrocella sp. FN5]MDF1617720.1 hypothetical protein [Petrocella sp. FN5]
MNGFMIRESALKDNYYYIDYNGEYELSKLSACTGITEKVIEHIYMEYDGVLDSDKGVFYFNKRGNAADAVEDLNSRVIRSKTSRTVELTEEEIEYIRKALINEDSNIIFTKNTIRTSIFNKLNK